MGKATIRDVAKAAKVGIGTVSRVLNNSPKVSLATRMRVLGVIQNLDFHPNNTARLLSRKIRIHNIGVITPPFTNYYAFADRLRGVQRGLAQTPTDYELTLFSVSSLAHFDDQLALILQVRNVEGLLIIDMDLTEMQVDALRQAGIPFAGLNHFRGRSWTCIGTDNIEGGQLATEFLINLGHTRIAYVGDDFPPEYGWPTGEERCAGYKSTLRKHGIEPLDELIRLGPYDYQSAKTRTFALLDLPEPPTAIFAMSDFLALGCIAAIRQRGLRVPEDISVIGYDNLELSFHTGLTTVSQHLELSGELGIKYILSMHGGAESEPAAAPSLPPQSVIVRYTTQSISAA
ncbi:MAG: LacI family DNA-binding transcriptional regulator [Anaerolinea sp.]|nr:LacI family DNA-binding transcriptional regulator [Anaerolinea sp.]MCC6972521.1 LacI family DNA-binding transcriptional regulator [Anaerolineae bacterium]